MPPRRLPFMSGEFDNPRASDSANETADQIILDLLDNTRSADEISPSGELYRYIERFHRRRRLENPSTQELPSMPPETEPERRRRSREVQAQDSPLFALPQQPSIVENNPQEYVASYAASRLAGGSGRRGRPRMPPSDRYLLRQRELMGENSVTSSRHGMRGLDELRAATRELNEASSSLLQDAGRQLELASSTLRGFLDDPDNPPMDSQSPAEADTSRRVKRRKLDTDKIDSNFTGFKYGKYGQVEPGKLKMEIVSCDGGIFDEPNIRSEFAAENVLRNDTTVYCTKSNRCNLVLRHQGATVFSLTELIIKAPHTGYTAPVQEGMVFMSMTLDDLLTRTAQYQIQYSPARNRRPGSRGSNELAPIISIRHNNDGSMTTAQARARRLYDIGQQDEDCDYRTAQIPSEFTTSAPPFQVTTELSDSEEDTVTTRLQRRSLHRIIGGGLRFEESDSSDSDRPQSLRPALSSDLSTRSQPRRRVTADITADTTLSDAVEASQIATQEAVRAVGGELMVPHARFFIERDKSKCTVRFDPPVSARFILLKMWSPQHSPSGNIDIQSVVAKGFAGPRFFSAITMR